MEEKKSKKSIWTALLVILIILLMAAMIQVRELRDEIALMRSQYSFEIYSLQSKINEIYANVDDQLNKEASLLTSWNHTSGNLDKTNRTVPVTVTVTPKSVTDDTKLCLVIGNGIPIPMARQENGAIFSATCSVGLFESDVDVTIQIEENGVTRTEEIDLWLAYLCTDYLPYFSADMVGATSLYGTTLHYNKNLTLHIETVNDIMLSDFTLVTKINDDIISEEKLDSQIIDGGIERGKYQKEYDMSYGDTLVLYITAKDSLGYTHKLYIENLTYTSRGESEMETWGKGEILYDENGTVVYQPDWIWSE